VVDVFQKYPNNWSKNIYKVRKSKSSKYELCMYVITLHMYKHFSENTTRKLKTILNKQKLQKKNKYLYSCMTVFFTDCKFRSCHFPGGKKKIYIYNKFSL